MAHIEFVDETLRDGTQSLWGMRMQAGMVLPITGNLDRTGFRRIELTGSNHFEVLVRYCRENPWQMLDAIVESMPRTVIRSGMRSNAMATFRTSPDALMDTWMRQLCRHG
jgi:oxaloacetate decarboxylase alpha subunit